MFTGLVETVGTLESRQARGQAERLEIRGPRGAALRPRTTSDSAWWSRCTLGESIAVAGACLTVAEVRADGFVADVSIETLSKTTLGDVAVGASVNLERALTLGAPLGGHLVLGHVDGVGRVERLSDREGYRHAVVSVPPNLALYLAPKGSVTLDGVSLTINASAEATIELMLVPHTLRATTLGAWQRGAKVNVEIDPLARYAVHYLSRQFGGGMPLSNPPPEAAGQGSEPDGARASGESSLEETLARAGFLTREGGRNPSTKVD